MSYGFHRKAEVVYGHYPLLRKREPVVRLAVETRVIGSTDFGTDIADASLDLPGPEKRFR